jgi:hypothetical protein
MHRLETAFQRGVFLDVLAVFVQRGRAHATEFAARKLRFHDVRRVRRAFRRARADDCVQLVNEQNDFAFAGHNLLEKRLEPVLEFAAIFRAGNHRAQIHGHEPLVLERFGHVAAHDAPGQALGNRRLAHARFADEHRIVFVRRVSTCMTRRISSSRPMTGSIFPCRASAVRSRPYLSSAWNLASGCWSVTRWLPRNSASAFNTVSRLSPCVLKIFSAMRRLRRANRAANVQC